MLFQLLDELMFNCIFRASMLAAIFIVSSCSGSDSAGKTGIGNIAPDISGLREIGFSENSDFKFNIDITDKDGTVKSVTIEGNDSSIATVVGVTEVAVLIKSPDFENPRDSNTDNVYNFTVIATDDKSLVEKASFSLAVEDVYENSPPVISGFPEIVIAYEENNTSPVTNISTNDVEPISYTVSGVHADFFSINESGLLSFANPPDFENPFGNSRNEYLVNVTASDEEFSSNVEVRVTVFNIEENPPLIHNPGMLSFLEFSKEIVTTVSATDPEGDDVSFFLEPGVGDNDSFAISNEGVLTFSILPRFGDRCFHLDSINDECTLRNIDGYPVIAEPMFAACQDIDRNCIFEVVVSATDASRLVGTERIFVKTTDYQAGLFAPPGMDQLSFNLCDDNGCQNYINAAPTVFILDLIKGHGSDAARTFIRTGPVEFGEIELGENESQLDEIREDEGPYGLIYRHAISDSTSQELIISEINDLGYGSDAEIIFSASLTLFDFTTIAEAFPNSVFVFAAGNEGRDSFLRCVKRIAFAEDGTRTYFGLGLNESGKNNSINKFECQDFEVAEGVEYEIERDDIYYPRFDFYFEMRRQNRILVVGGTNERIGEYAIYEGGLHRKSNSNLFAEGNYITAPYSTEYEDDSWFSGTSASAPQVSSAMAAIKFQYPDLTAKEVIQVLLALAVQKVNISEHHRDLPDPGALDLSGLFNDSGEILTLLQLRELIAGN